MNEAQTLQVLGWSIGLIVAVTFFLQAVALSSL
jgi:hypothetical protein